MSQSCPICRKKLIINNAIWDKYRDVPKQNTINNIIKIIFKYVTLLFLLHISIKIIVFIVARF